MGSHSLLQKIFLTQGLDPSLLYCKLLSLIPNLWLGFSPPFSLFNGHACNPVKGDNFLSLKFTFVSLFKLQYLATSWEELTHWKRLWCWEGLWARREGDDRGWDGWMASLTRWMWVSVNSGSWWWTGRPGVLWFMGSQRVGHDWATDLIWSLFMMRVSPTSLSKFDLFFNA